MKKFFLGWVLVAGFTWVKAQTADEIVSRHIEALGGKANIEKITSVMMEGSLDVQGNPLSLKVTRVQNKLARQDFSIMGMTGYDLTTDKEGWTFMPFAGQTAPVQKSAEELKESQEDMDITDDLYNYQEKGNQLTLLGKETIGGVDCYKIKVMGGAGSESTYYIDPATFYTIRVVQVKKVNGQAIPISVDYADYRDVDGMKMPFTMSSTQGSITFTSIKANQTIDPKAYLHE